MEQSAKFQRPQFSEGANEQIFQLLRKDVREITDRLAPERKMIIRSKAFVFPFFYFVLWMAAMFFGNDHPLFFYFMYVGLGLMIVIIFLNIIHDAVHGTIFKSRRLNDLFVYLFDLMGANSFIWRLRHVRFHHNYPNVDGWDTDIEKSDIVRIFPSGTPSRVHKYQHIYLPFIYPFFLFNWLLIRDFRDFFSSQKIVRKLVKIPFREYIKLFIFKGLFFFYLILFPVLFIGMNWWQVLNGFFLMVLSASLFSLIVLLPPHANIYSEFPLPDEKNKLPQNWLMHMLLTTNDVAADNRFTRFFLGCFNYHVVHHLFPNVNHAFYPEITEKLKEYSERYSLPYRRLPLGDALFAHFQLLKQNATDFNIWEESM